MSRVPGSLPALCLQVLILGALVGCGASGDGYSGSRGTVKGTITMDGKPLQSGCQVIFMSSQGGYTASGVIGEGGNYSLTYAHGEIPAVEYLVQLTAPVSTTTQEQDPSKMAGAMKLSRKNTGESSDGPFPLRYGSIATSKMSFTVKSGENKADFALTSK